MAVIYCWGGNLRGQLGNGVFTPDHIATPSPVPGLTFTRLSAGVVHTCALATDGLMYCWGAGYLSQLGTGSTSDQPAPQAVGHQ
jgi:alpha-tubulin suppressor-like RCC1 family protein